MTNEFYRFGKGDEYVELCMDWQSDYYTRMVWWIQEMVGGDKYSNESLAKAFREVADSIDKGDLE